MQAASMPVGKLRRKHASVQTELMTIEVRTSSGAEMRLTGSFSTLLVVECRRKFRIRHLLHFAKGAYHHAHNFDSGEVHRFTEMDVDYTGQNHYFCSDFGVCNTFFISFGHTVTKTLNSNE